MIIMINKVLSKFYASDLFVLLTVGGSVFVQNLEDSANYFPRPQEKNGMVIDLYYVLQ